MSRKNNIRTLTPAVPTPAIAPALLNERDAAKFLGLARITLAKWRMVGRGPEFCRIGSAIRYPVDSLQRYIDASIVRREVAA